MIFSTHYDNKQQRVGLMEQNLRAQDYHHAFIYGEQLFNLNPKIDRLYQTLVNIVGNLVDNAIRYTPAGGNVTIAASKHKNNKSLKISINPGT